MALEAAGGDRAQADGKQDYGAADGQGDTGGGLPRPVRRGGGNDTEAAGGKELERRMVFWLKNARFAQVISYLSEIQYKRRQGQAYELY